MYKLKENKEKLADYLIAKAKKKSRKKYSWDELSYEIKKINAYDGVSSEDIQIFDRYIESRFNHDGVNLYMMR